MLRFPFCENLFELDPPVFDGWTSFSPVFSKVFRTFHVTTASPLSLARGKNFLLFDQRAGLAVQRIQLAPNGNSDRRINKWPGRWEDFPNGEPMGIGHRGGLMVNSWELE